MLSAGPETFAHNSFEFCTSPPRVTADDAVIIFSHRGTKRSSYDALDYAISTGAYTVAITSTAPGPRIQAAHHMIQTVSPEISSAFTVSYTTALTVIAMINRALKPGGGDSPAHAALSEFHALTNAEFGLEQLPELAGRVLSYEDAVVEVVDQHHDKRRFISAAWGANRANAYEVALKIKETSRADCEGFRMSSCSTVPSAR